MCGWVKNNGKKSATPVKLILSCCLGERGGTRRASQFRNTRHSFLFLPSLITINYIYHAYFRLHIKYSGITTTFALGKLNCHLSNGRLSTSKHQIYIEFTLIEYKFWPTNRSLEIKINKIPLYLYTFSRISLFSVFLISGFARRVSCFSTLIRRSRKRYLGLGFSGMNIHLSDSRLHVSVYTRYTIKKQ